MRVFVATSATQGTRASDSMRCVDGELVWLRDVCPASRRRPDGPCECGRSFSGLSSNNYTTTAVVRDIPGLTRTEYEAALTASFDAQEWCPCCTSRSVEEVIDELIRLAGVFPAGAVLERRINDLNLRGSLGSGA
ncbi:hypothetical protein BJQ94_13305 [Cryobacterium sp. SO2]|uniref:DUF7715 family protein n=1 Tax=Cryobacterium sp. SO2 TaxID=1897060 RepID=UPI00223C9385|nr:hypothetical protein [Cryobacterium sp. SO2]WEO76336.1 hypothetical protein BJQ94_13305 [Cryobacterium sp. SO2]